MKGETFEQFMQRAFAKEFIREAVVRIATRRFFNDSRKQGEAAVSEWEKVHGALTGTK